MNDAELMKICYSTDNIFKETTSLNLLQFWLFDDIVKQFSLLNVFHN